MRNYRLRFLCAAARLPVATAVQEAVDRFGRLDMLARVTFPAATRIFWASHLLTHN